MGQVHAQNVHCETLCCPESWALGAGWGRWSIWPLPLKEMDGACGLPKEPWGFLPQLYSIPWGCARRGPGWGLHVLRSAEAVAPFSVRRGVLWEPEASWLEPCHAQGSPCPHSHLSHRHPLRWAALQENLVVMGYFLAQRLLVEVLAQVWGKGEGKARQSWRLKCLAMATRWQCTPRERSRGHT